MNFKINDMLVYCGENGTFKHDIVREIYTDYVKKNIYVKCYVIEFFVKDSYNYVVCENNVIGCKINEIWRHRDEITYELVYKREANNEQC